MYHTASDSSSLSQPIDRRGWLRGVIGILFGAISTIVGIVAGGAVLAPGFAKRGESWVPAARLRDLRDDEPTAVTVRVSREDGYYEAVDQQVVFLIKSAAGDVRALSSTCTHLGCRIRHDRATQAFKCHCHGGTFTTDGAVIGGPPPRALSRLPTRVDGAQVFVQI